MQRKINAPFSYYRPSLPEAADWGLELCDCGFSKVPQHSHYPLQEHPDEFLFDWKKGRTLDEYQFVYISRGQGIFRSKNNKITKLQAGSLMILTPGVWHLYRPDTEIGWEEYWVGFRGETAQRLMTHFFTEDKPVLNLGLDEGLIEIFQNISNQNSEDSLDRHGELAGQMMQMIGRVHWLSNNHTSVGVHNKRMVEARLYIQEHAYEEVDLGKLAEEINMSYSNFRSAFKKYTGLPPRQFQISIRMNRAKNLLSQTDTPVSEISDALGFESIAYFSRIFKKNIGISPREYRNTQVGPN
ncbi:MAG: AraC family transcriptional regulator [Planctomycetes bacterium]|nr:AraC family transcriptional regulator [Planctomycetota bacterium]